MKDLLMNYTVSDILIFVTFLAIALKGVITFIDWGMARLRAFFGKESDKEKRKIEIDNKIDKIYEMQVNQQMKINEMAATINLLTESDKDTIKAWITEKHHYFCYEVKAIDYFSLDSIKKRYNHYKAENGNSFVDTLMKELEALPKIESDMILRTQENYDLDRVNK